MHERPSQPRGAFVRLGSDISGQVVGLGCLGWNEEREKRPKLGPARAGSRVHGLTGSVRHVGRLGLDHFAS